MGRPLRMVCLGDSWVSDWDEDPAGWKMRSPLASALRAGLQERGQEVELTVVGFPGGTAARVLALAEICGLQGMAVLSSRGRSIKGNLEATLAEQEIPTIAAGGVDGDVDIIVILLGTNDLNHYASGADVVDRLMGLKRLYRQRGIQVVMVSIAGPGPGEAEDMVDFERRRRWANGRLLAEDGVVDADELLEGLDPDVWVNGWHLTAEGYGLLGSRLARAVAARFSSPEAAAQQGLIEQALGYVNGQCHGSGAARAAPLLQVSGCRSPAVSRLIAGPYMLEGTNHGRPVYRKLGAPGSATVLVYFWDDRDGPDWAGWWLAPRMAWEDPGWARHDDHTTESPPATGWRVPVDGPADETLRVSCVAR